MTKKYYGVLDSIEGALRNGFVFTDYNIALKEVSQGIMEVTNNPEILELDETDYETILEFHNFEIVEISKEAANEIKDKEFWYVNAQPEAFYFGDY